MDLDKILIKLEKQGWKLEKDFLDNNQNFLQDLVDETEKAINYTLCCKSDSEQLNHDFKIGDDVYIVSKKLVEILDIHRNGKIILVKDGLETYLVDGDGLEKVV